MNKIRFSSPTPKCTASDIRDAEIVIRKIGIHNFENQELNELKKGVLRISKLIKSLMESFSIDITSPNAGETLLTEMEQIKEGYCSEVAKNIRKILNGNIDRIPMSENIMNELKKEASRRSNPPTVTMNHSLWRDYEEGSSLPSDSRKTAILPEGEKNIFQMSKIIKKTPVLPEMIEEKKPTAVFISEISDPENDTENNKKSPKILPNDLSEKMKALEIEIMERYAKLQSNK